MTSITNDDVKFCRLKKHETEIATFILVDKNSGKFGQNKNKQVLNKLTSFEKANLLKTLTKKQSLFSEKRFFSLNKSATGERDVGGPAGTRKS